jgi:hypothetical protein
MARRTLLALSLAPLMTALLAGSMAAAAQPASAPNRQARTQSTQPGSGADRATDSIAYVTLGQAAVPLNGPWKFTVGDSPADSKTGNPLWAEPDFDDSHWESVDLTPQDGAVSPIAGSSGYVPGWTTRGHAGYSGYAWYRIRVRCQGGGSTPPSLAGPANVDDAYQVFVNGKLLGNFGDFSAKQPVIYYSQPFRFGLSDGCQKEGTAQVLAFRLWMEPMTLLNVPDAGGMHSAPLLGDSDVIGLLYQSQWMELIRGYLMAVVEAVVFALLAVVAFSLILFDRSDRVYLWIGLLFLAMAEWNAWDAATVWSQWIPVRLQVVVDGVVTAVIFALWGMVWWVWFGRAGFRWLPGVLSGLGALTAVSGILGQEIFPQLVSHPVALRLFTLNQSLRFVFLGLLAWIVIDGIRRKGLDGWLVLPVVVLHGVGGFGTDLIRLHLFHNWFPFGVTVTPTDIANYMIAAVIALLLLRRLLQSVKRQRLMALDVKQAQEVQQVILPEAWLALPGLTIESEYRPAREVGGDFFQIIPHKTDGSLLIVAGDVTGKGLKAGMLVALLVGAIRTEENHNTDPAGLLSTLNQRLLGRADAQATCVALRIAADGSVTLANAGHVAPYLNGDELPMEGALPLGMFEGAEPSRMQFQLKPGDRLTLMSDGIAEATDENGQLFGFERVNELLRTAKSIAEIAAAAQAFGQEDDISVISVTRTAVFELVPA